MTLADLVNYVCTATGYIEGDDQAACRTFLLARDRMIYDSALWKDSLVMAQVAIDPVANLDNAAGVVLLPQVIGRPVGVRTTENAVRVNALEQYFRFDADKFTETGTPFEFAEQGRVWFTVRPNPKALVAVPVAGTYNSEDEAFNFFRVVNTVAGQSYFLRAGANDFGTKPEAPLAPGQSQVFLANVGAKNLYGKPNLAWTGLLDQIKLGAFQSSGPGATLTLTGDAGTNVKVVWRDAAGKQYVTEGVLPLTLTPSDGAGYFDIIKVSKPVTNGPLTVTLNDATGFTAQLAQLGPMDTSSPDYVRLRLFGIPSMATTIKVLGKAIYTPLDFDQQEQTVRNSENALIAFARGDVLRRGGENGAAAAIYQEGAALLQQLKDVEAIQAANNQRIIPDQGYGPEWGIGPYIRPFF